MGDPAGATFDFQYNGGGGAFAGASTLVLDSSTGLPMASGLLIGGCTQSPVGGLPGVAGELGFIGAGFTSGIGLVIQGAVSPGAPYITPGSSQPMGWDIGIWNSQGFFIGGVETGNGGDNYCLELGAVRASTEPLGTSALLLSDFIANGTVTGFGEVVPGSGYVDGVYPDVPLHVVSGTAGSLAKGDVTVSGGEVTSVVLHPQPRGGYGYDTTTVLSATAAKLGGSGSGFSVQVASVTSGAQAGPFILWNSVDTDFTGLGPLSGNADNTARFGGTVNTRSAWDNTSNGVKHLAMAGRLILGTVDGTSFAQQASLQAISGGVAVYQPGTATLAALEALLIPPTTDPHVAGALWNNGGTPAFSAG